MDNSNLNSNNACRGVERSWKEELHTIFETLFLEKKCLQQDLADYLGIDKSYISRMVWGKEFPPLRLRLKIAKFFDLDSCLIWRVPKIYTADKWFEMKEAEGEA